MEINTYISTEMQQFVRLTKGEQDVNFWQSHKHRHTKTITRGQADKDSYTKTGQIL